MNTAVADEWVHRFVVRPSPTMYSVAAMVHYAFVDAENEGRARERGKATLKELYAELRQRHPGMAVEIRTMRPAQTTRLSSAGGTTRRSHAKKWRAASNGLLHNAPH
jgi:hypothetical protein